MNYEKICSYNYQYFATPSADFIVAPQINQIFWVDFHQKHLFSAPLDDIPDQVVPIVSDGYKPMAVKAIIEKPLDFTLSKTEGKVPLAIDFKSQFSGQADSYLWDFGDGSTSTEENPSHIYEKTGIFTVKLQISKNGKKDSVIKKDLVESYMSGYISGTLPANLSPYHIRESLIVSSRLSIEPGAILIFDDSDQVGINLSGELIAKGTESNPIIFTCKTLFNGSKLSWQGIKADEGSKLVLQHCHLDNAVFGVQAQSGTDLEISNSSLTECYSTAIVIGDEGFGSSNHIIRENIIENNKEWGIKLVCVATINDKNIQTPIKGNLIQNNGAGGLYLEARGAGSSSWTSTSATAEIESEITSNQIRFNNGPALQFRADGKRTEGQHSVHVAHGYVSPLIQNNIFEGNSASILSNTGVGSSNLNNCTIQLDKNTFFNAGPFELDGNTIVSLTNSIIWGHVAPVVSLQNSAEMTITYSNIKGGFEGTGNLELEPLFVDAENGNFHLSPTSPCIDSGDPAADYTSEPMPNGGRVNMGAFGNTKDAQTSAGTVVASNLSQPYQFKIAPPFPNPFNSQTTIHFSLDKSQQVRIDVINTNGQIVQTICNEHKNSGSHVFHWNAGELSSGIYFLQLSTPYKTAIQKCTLIK
ncbi:T9SS type A sorting domain-containing protein [candidate division KSB1 bacterium]|nr:T9SS type A sorting domain-containing protein [candidate division KSB1 bacterium]